MRGKQRRKARNIVLRKERESTEGQLQQAQGRAINFRKFKEAQVKENKKDKSRDKDFQCYNPMRENEAGN